jgi:cytochrome c oxidase subunit II
VTEHVRSTPGPPLTSEAETVDRVWTLFMAGAGVVGLLVVALVAYCAIRFRRRDDEMPVQKRHNIPIEILYTSVPLAIVIVLFVVTAISVRDVDRVSATSPDVVVDVVGFQWQWQFTYPESGVTVVGSREQVPELVLPSASRVRFRVTSADVVHSFWIPGFRFKRDLIPGQVTEFDVDILEVTGSFANAGECAEYCGLDHAIMRFSLRILPQDQFDDWTRTTRAEATS